MPSLRRTQVSNTLLLQDIVYKSGPGINTYGMPKGLALKMNKDEEVLLSIAHTLAPATPSNFSHPLYIYSLTLARSLFFHSHPPPIHIRDKTQYQAARIPCSEMCLYTREVYFYSSGIQREVDVLSPEVYGVWTDGTANDEFNCIMLEDMTVNWKGFSGYVQQHLYRLPACAPSEVAALEHSVYCSVLMLTTPFDVQ